jgi:hypothetical protein
LTATAATATNVPTIESNNTNNSGENTTNSDGDQDDSPHPVGTILYTTEETGLSTSAGSVPESRLREGVRVRVTNNSEGLRYYPVNRIPYYHVQPLSGNVASAGWVQASALTLVEPSAAAPQSEEQDSDSEAPMLKVINSSGAYLYPDEETARAQDGASVPRAIIPMDLEIQKVDISDDNSFYIVSYNNDTFWVNAADLEQMP